MARYLSSLLNFPKALVAVDKVNADAFLLSISSGEFYTSEDADHVSLLLHFARRYIRDVTLLRGSAGMAEPSASRLMLQSGLPPWCA